MNPLEKLINDLESKININKKSIKKYCKQISECDSLKDSLIFSYSLQGNIIKISVIENWLPSIKENPIKANEDLVDFIFREMYGLKSPHHTLKTDRDRHYYLAQLVDLRHQLNNALDNNELEGVKEMERIFAENDVEVIKREIKETEEALANISTDNINDIQPLRAKLNCLLMNLSFQYPTFQQAKKKINKDTLEELDVLFKETDKEVLHNEIEELESILENTPEENVIDIQSIKARLVKLKSKIGMVLTQPKKVDNPQ